MKRRKTNTSWFHLYMLNIKTKQEQPHRNRESYQKEVSGRMGEKRKGNIVSDIMSLHGTGDY